jgi:hypothetical protein
MSELAKMPDERNAAPCAADETVQPTMRSLRGLDWLNFLLADVQTGVGPFLAFSILYFFMPETREKNFLNENL